MVNKIILPGHYIKAEGWESHISFKVVEVFENHVIAKEPIGKREIKIKKEEITKVF